MEDKEGKEGKEVKELDPKEFAAVRHLCREFVLEACALGVAGIRAEYEKVKAYMPKGYSKKAFEENMQRNRYKGGWLVEVVLLLLHHLNVNLNMLCMHITYLNMCET